MKRTLVLFAFAGLVASTQAQNGTLFIGQGDGEIMAKQTDLSSFPAVNFTDAFVFDMHGAAATPSGTLYLTQGSFSSDIYVVQPGGSPTFVVHTAIAFHGLGYVNGKLYGFANFASPMGIYEIDTATGLTTLRVSLANEGLRFFALDGNPADNLLYGFSEYGNSGLWSINPETGAMHRIAGTPPGSYGMFRGMAVGNNTAYMVDAHPTDTNYGYLLSQGDNGTFVPFVNPFPDSRNGGGAWIAPPGPPANDNCAAATPVHEGVFSFNSQLATTDGSASCGGTNDAWWLFTPSSSGVATFETCSGTSFNTILSLHDTCGGSEIACNDDYCGSQSRIEHTVTQGVPVLVRVAGWDSGFGALSISMPPVNDACAGATTVGEGTHDFSTVGSSTDGFGSCTSGYNDVWFSYVPTATGTVRVETCGHAAFDTVLGVFDACGGNELACNDDFCSVQSSVTFSATQGVPVLVRVAAYDAAVRGAGQIVITSLSPPANDSCAAATPIGEGTFPFNSTFATTDGATSCGFGGDTGAHDVWWLYTPSATGTVEAATCGLASFDSQINALESCGGAELACNDDGCGVQSRITFAVSSGVPVLLRVAGWNNQSGAGSISVVLTPAPCDPDVNCDGVPDQDDVACIILAVAGDMTCFCQADPDFNGDGVPDQGDVADVILTVAGAPCP